MIELKGTWTDKEINEYVNLHPNKFVVVEKKILLFDIGEKFI